MEIHYTIYDYIDKQINRSINQLYQKVFSADMGDDLSFIFRPNPFGKAIGIIAQNEDGQVVGHFATMATAALVDSIHIPGRISFGFMVDDDYRGMHIASTMSDELFSYLDEQQDCHFVIGFPNENSYHMHISVMGYLHLRDMQMVVLPKEIMQRKEEDKFYPVEVLHINETADVGNHIDHTLEMLNWRFSESGYMKFQSADGKVFVCNRYQDSMQILYWDSNVPEKQLLDFAGYLYKQYDVAAVRTWDCMEWLKKYPTEDRKWHFCINILPMAEQNKENMLNDWLFFPGDSELF